jgi:phospholipid transport system substrate-binding protein
MAGSTILLAVLLALLPGIASGEQPIDALKRTVDDGLQILKDPDYLAADRKALQKHKLMEILYRDFDFTEFSRRVLAEKWPLFSRTQRIEFIEVFSRFLTEFYLSRLQKYYTGGNVGFRGQTITGPSRALVKTHVLWESREFPVDVRMHFQNGRWKTYDVSVLGISAVQIYRAQFQEIMSTQSPGQVIDLIRRRIEAQ